MPKAPTYTEPSRNDPALPDQDAPARRSHNRVTPNTAHEGPDGSPIKGSTLPRVNSDQGPKPGPGEAC